MKYRFAPALLAGLALSGCATTSAQRTTEGPVTVGIIAINDFHGALELPKQSMPMPGPDGKIVPVPAGGAAWLASAVDSVRRKYANSVTVSAGDLIGGTPITSALYLDEPAIGVMNRIGLEYNAVGNHEFDLGVAELRRKQRGGCQQHTARKPCQVEKFGGSRFSFLAANTLNRDGSTLFPATALKSFGSGRRKVTVGIIGMTLKETSGLVPVEVLSDVSFSDEADNANLLAARLRAQGADAVMLLIHQGGRTSGTPDPNACENLSDDIRPILDRLDTTVDLVVSGHTHWAYVCDYSAYNPAKPFLLTSGGLWGKAVTDITLEIDPATNRVVNKKAHNVIVQSPSYGASMGRIENTSLVPAFEPRPDVADYVARYVSAAKDYSLRRIGWLAGPIDKMEGPLSNTGGPLGNLIADAQLAATAGAGAQIAFMNPFGIRRSLVVAPDYSVTFGDLYAVQPFNNELVTLSLTGANIKQMLERNFDPALGPEQVMTPSAGFTYSYDRSQPINSRIVAMSLNGVPVDAARSYRVTVSNFLANGGDGYREFVKGENRVGGVADISALEAWLKAEPPRAIPSASRTTDLRPELNPNNRTLPPGQKYRR